MNAAAAFENRKETLRLQLDAAQTLDEGVAACIMALEQTACELAQDEQDELCRQRQQAVMAIARRAPQLLRASAAKGELVAKGEQAREGELDRREKTRRILRVLGVFALASLAVHELIDGKAIFALLQLAGAALLYAGGTIGVQDGGPVYAARGVAAIDSGAMVRQLAELCQAADICTGDLMLIDQEAGRARLCGTADEAMLDLLIVLMEAKTSGRDDLAMRSLAQAEQYLHMLGIEAVFWDGTRPELFDMLPTLGVSRTIRPALMKDGKLLRRGAAACAMERSAAQ